MWIDDQILNQCKRAVVNHVWIPEKSMIVLGSSNKSSVELHEENVSATNTPVLKRYGGGGTVILYKGCVVVSLGCWVAHQFKNDFYFDKINQAVIDALASKWPKFAGLSQSGLSDIVLGDKKVAGTSMFRSKNYLLYQASILVDLDLELIEKLIKQPSKQPEYRGNRKHEDFLIGLSGIEAVSPSQVEVHLQQVLEESLLKNLGDELSQPQKEQFKNIFERVARNNHAGHTHNGLDLWKLLPKRKLGLRISLFSISYINWFAFASYWASVPAFTASPSASARRLTMFTRCA
jgi:lipoate-protein ligase A